MFFVGCIKFVDIDTSGQNFFPQELLIHRNKSAVCQATVGKQN